MQPLRVVPMHPAEGRELEVIDCFPRPVLRRRAYELGLVIPIDALGEGIVIALSG